MPYSEKLALEERLLDFKEGKLTLAEAALIASGMRDEKELSLYLGKFEKLSSKLDSYLIRRGIELADGYAKAEAIHNFLWYIKPAKYNKRIYKFSDAVDNALDRCERRIGSCIALTLLYNALAERQGLKTALLVSQEHMMAIVKLEKQEVVVEHGSVYGFDLSSKQLAQKIENSWEADNSWALACLCVKEIEKLSKPLSKLVPRCTAHPEKYTANRRKLRQHYDNAYKALKLCGIIRELNPELYGFYKLATRHTSLDSTIKVLKNFI